jgi:heme a synthase
VWKTNSHDLRWLRRGLVLAVLWCLLLISFGAFVRLSDAGLGCPDWPTCYGKLSWPKAHEVDLANVAFPARPVEMHKTWPEQVHRHIAAGLGLLVFILTLLGRTQLREGGASARQSWLLASAPIFLGAAAIALAMVLYIKGFAASSGLAMLVGELILLVSAMRSRGLARWLTLTLALICFQALLGIWTVTLLVKPAVVTAHLLGGLATLSLLLYCALLAHQRSESSPYARRASLSPWLVRIGMLLLVMQITLGGWVSTNYAALACPDFPKCKGQWLPETDFKEGFVLWREVGVNYEGGVLDAPARAAVHLTHRIGAVVVGSYLFWLAFLSIRRRSAALFPGRDLRMPGVALLITLIAQITLGISNVVFALPLWVAVAHNAMAALLLCAMIWLWWRNNAQSNR